jgi:death-on-curing protein
VLYRPNVEDVLYIYEQEVAPTLAAAGQPHGVADHHRLDAALARPWRSAGGEDAFPDFDLKAAALCEALSNYQPFVDGNKRTALLTTQLFYSYAGYIWLAPLDDGYDLLDCYMAQTRPVDLEYVAEHFRNWRKPVPEAPDY